MKQRDCQKHAFCKVEDFQAVTDIEENTPIPFPLQVAYNRDPDRREDELKIKLAEYKSVLNKHRDQIKLGDMGRKVTVSDYAMAHWYCQIFKLDINNLTQTLPQHLSREQYSKVKEVVKPYVQGIQEQPTPEQALYKSHFYEEYKKRFPQKPLPKSMHKEINQMDSSPGLRSFNRLDKNANQNSMKDYQPFMYEASKRVDTAKVFGLQSYTPSEDEEKSEMLMLDAQLAKLNSVMPQSTEPLQSPYLKSVQSTPTSSKVQASNKQDSQSTRKKQKVVGQGEINKKMVGNDMNVISEDEEEVTPQSIGKKSMMQFHTNNQASFITVSSPQTRTNIALDYGKNSETKEDHKSFSGLALSPKQMRHKSSEPASRRIKSYNPKTSEQVKFFFAHYEQQALENKMRNHFVQHEIKQLSPEEDTKEKKDKVERRYAKLDWNELHQNFISEFKETVIEKKQESQNLTSTQKENARYDVKGENQVAKPGQTTQNRNKSQRVRGVQEKLLRLNKALEQQRKAGKSAQKTTDISMRARREMLFKETMTLNQDVHLRQGRTYSKKFNKQFNENDKEEGTTFQHLQNFKITKEHAAQELDKNRYGKEAYTILSSQRTQNEKDKMRQTHTQLSRPLETAVTRAQTAENAGLISKIHRMRVANTQQAQDETLAEIVRRKHIETNRLKTIQVQRINQRSFRSVNHQSKAQNHMNQTWFSQRSFRDQDLRGAEQTITKNYVTLKQSKIQQSEPRAISLDQDEKFRLSKSAQRFNKASFMNINDCDTPKAISTIDTQIMRKEGLNSHKRALEDDGLGDKAEYLSNSTAKYKTKSTGPRSSARSNVELAKLETNATERNSKEKKKAWYTVQPEEFNVEVQEPKYYFQKELITELPLYQPDTQIQSKHSDKNIFKSADFWLSQGHQKSQKKGQNPDPDRHSVALDYYLSGVKIDPQHYGCIYNTGCCHFFTGKFMNALKWFNLCIKVNPYCPDGYYGKSISCLKLGVQDSVNYYEEALQAIEKIDLSNRKVVILESSSKGRQSQQAEPEMQESTNFSKNQIIFVHAMLCKILGFAEKSKKLYNGLNDQIHADQCVRMKKQVFSVVLISLQKERRITEDTLNEFCEEVTLYNPQDCYDEQFTKDLKKLQYDISQEAQKRYLPRFLNKLPLFQRLKVQSLQKNYLSKMTIIEKKRGEQIVLPNNQTVQIVLNGKIVLREHNIENPSKFDIVQIVKQGQVIGDPELDQGKSLLPFVWAVVQSQQLQLVQMDLDDFRMMWQETRQRELEVSMSFLNMNDFFKQLSKQTLYNIIYEKCIRVKYSPGQLVMPIHSRSPWNIKTFKMYQAAQEQNFESDQNKMNVTQNQLLQEKKAQQADFQKHVEQNQKKKEHELNLNSRNSQNTQNTPRETSKIRPIVSRDKFSQFSNLMNSQSSKSSRYLERKKTRFLQQKQSKASDEFLMNVSDTDTEDEDSERSAFRPIMIIRQGNAELKNTKKKYLQEEWERTKSLRRGIDQNRSNIKSQVMIEREQEKEILITRLSTGTVFGESDCLQIIGYEFLGDIYAGKGGLECLVIQQPDLVLAEYERQLLKNVLHYQHTTLIQMSETQNNLLGMNPLKEF